MRIVYAKDGTTHTSSHWPQQADTIWVDVGSEDRDSLDSILNRLYPSHPVAIQKVLDASDRQPSLLVEPKAVTAVLQEPDGSIDHLIAHPIGIFLGKKFLVTTHLEGSSSTLDQVYEHVRRDNGLGHGADMALYHYLDLHIRQWRAVLKEISQGYEEIHLVMLRHPYHDLAHKILKLRRHTMTARHWLRPEREIFSLFGSKDFAYVREENHLYFDDLSDRMTELESDVESYRDGLSEAVEAYSSMQSNAINKVMRVLTLISVLALPATTIASIYGMNFKIPELKWSFGYYYSLALMAVVTFAVYLYMRHASRNSQ